MPSKAEGVPLYSRKVHVYCSKKRDGTCTPSFIQGPEERELILGSDESGGAQNPSVFIAPSCQVSKPWLGFGGSFTEASAMTLKSLSLEKQEEVLNAYFSGESGLGYNLGRISIGSCDFGFGDWTCGDLVEGDLQLKNFSISAYHNAILPMIRRASQKAGAPLTLLASPWSPPAWMKTSGRRDGENDGKLRSDCYNAWAFHFVRFIQEMHNAGAPIWGVTVQNEPEASQKWESCRYTAEEERDFVRDHLGPMLQQEGMGHIKIIIHDHNRAAMVERAANIYADAEAAKYIWGVGYHWYGDCRFESWPQREWVPFQDRQCGFSPVFELRSRTGFDNVRRVAELRPDKHIVFTEGCQELGDDQELNACLGDWKVAERYAMNIIADMNSGCEGWFDWNLLLDAEGGPNHQDNFCIAPVVLNDGEVEYQPCFRYLGDRKSVV